MGVAEFPVQLPAILEREDELGALDGLMRRARSRHGSFVLLEGPAGIGKTTLVDEVRIRAGEAGMRTLVARAGELEREFPFGVVRQLFEPVLMGSSPSQRRKLLSGAAQAAATLFRLGSTQPEEAAPLAGDRLFATLHGLYWLTVNICRHGPVVMLIDDAQWADASSLHWMAYLTPRLADLGILVVAALRSPEPDGSAKRLLSVLRAEPSATLVRLTPLTQAAVRDMIAAELSAEPHPRFCETCHRVTGGVPLFVRYLLAALKRDSVEPTEAAASSLPHVVPERILRTVVRRLEAMPPSASSLARAVAVFDGGVALVNAARLADLDVETARAAADILVAEEILKPDRPLEFVHPIVRQAVYSDLPPRLRMHYHRLAASMLVTDGAAPELSAGHLLRCYPAGEAWVVDVLRSAGRRALQRGSPDAAAAYFQRALEEPAEEKHRAGILWELGSAKAIGNEPDAADYLTIALEASGDLDERARIADELGRLLTVSGRADAAIDRLEPLLAEFQRNAPDLATRLAIDLGIAAWVASPPRPSLVDRLAWQYSQGDPHNGDHTPLIANCAFAAYAAGAPADFAAELAEKALAEGGFVAADADSPAFQFAVGVLTLTDRLELAGRLCDEAIETTRRRGSVSGAAAMSCWRSRNNLLRGAVSEAEADARVSLAVAREHGAWELGLPVSVAFLIDALIERGDLAAAEATLEESGLTGELPECLMSQLLLCARGRLRLLLGRPGAGIEDFLTCGSWQERWPLRAPGMAPWRTAAATALAAQGDRAQARQLVAEELEVTRAFGAPRPLAAALRAAAMVERGERGVELLREAVMVLEGSPARLETARVLIDLGALLRRVGRRREARETLRAGLDVAYHCGALALVELAREELVAVGVRPRRSALSGVDSLTPSELRVAKLATSGLTNPRIAQELFVTLRTVEMHLSNAYGKLGIRSRRELADALGHASERRELAGSGLRSA